MLRWYRGDPELARLVLVWDGTRLAVRSLGDLRTGSSRGERWGGVWYCVDCQERQGHAV